MPGGIIVPLSVIASWPTPNYVNPVSRGAGLIILTAVLCSLSTLFVCARIWARARLRNMGIDDWLIMITLVPALAMSALICITNRRVGFGHHIWDNPLPTSVNGRKFVMATEALYVLSTGLTKISILLFYRRLVAGTFSGRFVWAVRIIIFSVFAYMVTFLTTLIFGCRPMHAYWDQVNPVWRGLNKYKCLNEVATLYSANITSIIQDFLTFLMPLLLFSKLQLPYRQKVILGGIFSIGFFICIVGIIRIVYTEILYFQTYDVTWESVPLWYWTIVELHGAIMCASAPALKVFFKRFLRGASGGRRGGPQNNVPGYSDGAKRQTAEKDVELTGTSSTSYGSGSGAGDSAVSTFIGHGSISDYEAAAWPEKNGVVEGWAWDGNNENGDNHCGIAYSPGVDSTGLLAGGRREERFSTPSAVLMPLRKQGSGTLVNVPSARHFG